MEETNIEAMIIGAEVFQYAWWLKYEPNFQYDDKTLHAPDGWLWTITPLNLDDEESAGKAVTVGEDLLRQTIADIGAGKHAVSTECLKNCRRFIAESYADVDFDATSADEVLQIAVYGFVPYG